MAFCRVFSNNINSTEHIGTHIDAPSHTGRHGWYLNQIPLDHLIGPGVIIDVKDKAKNNPDYRVSADDVREWETKYGAIPDDAIVIMNSGWGSKYPDKQKVLHTDDIENTTSFHFPGFHEDAVSWIIRNRKMNVIGTDAPSFDYGQSRTFPVHVLIAKNNICGLENVANLDAIPPSGAIILIPAIKTIEGSGAPVRLLAMVPLSESTKSGSVPLSVISGKCIVSAIVLCLLNFFMHR